MAETVQLWDRLEGEPPHAYACFRTYLQLGPNRTAVDAARAMLGEGVNGGKRVRIPGSWQRNLARFRWKERALAWDVYEFLERHQRIMVIADAALEAKGRKLLEYFKRCGGPESAGWQLAVESLNALYDKISQEARNFMLRYSQQLRGTLREPAPTPATASSGAGLPTGTTPSNQIHPWSQKMLA